MVSVFGIVRNYLEDLNTRNDAIVVYKKYIENMLLSV